MSSEGRLQFSKSNKTDDYFVFCRYTIWGGGGARGLGNLGQVIINKFYLMLLMMIGEHRSGENHQLGER